MSQTSIGSAGEHYELVVRRGASTGVVTAQMLWNDDENDPVDLTGAVIRGWVGRKATGKQIVPVTVEVIDAANGIYSFEITETNSAKLPPDSDPMYPAHYWVLEMVEPGTQRVIPLYWGPAPVWPGGRNN